MRVGLKNTNTPIHTTRVVMKDSKEYSKKVRKLYRSLRQQSPQVKKVAYNEPLEAMVYATISDNMDEAKAEAAIKRINDHFMDLNDLRVSLQGEIVEVLGADTPVTSNLALQVTKSLREVFEKYNLLSLESLKKIGKRPARQALETIDGISRFVVDYCMLTAFGGHAIPLTKKMIEYLKSSELVHPDADEEEIEGFLTRQISADNGYEFYALLRRESESKKASRKKAKATRKGKTKPKTEKKTKKAKKAVGTGKTRK